MNETLAFFWATLWEFALTILLPAAVLTIVVQYVRRRRRVQSAVRREP